MSCEVRQETGVRRYVGLNILHTAVSLTPHHDNSNCNCGPFIMLRLNDIMVDGNIFGGAWRGHDINLHIVKNITQPRQVIIKKYWPLTNSDPSKAANITIYSIGKYG